MAGDQHGCRSKPSGHHGHEHHKDVRGEVRGDHREHRSEALHEVCGSDPRHTGDDVCAHEQHAYARVGEAPALEEPVGHPGLHAEPAAEGIECEEGRAPRHDVAGLGAAKAETGEPTATRRARSRRRVSGEVFGRGCDWLGLRERAHAEVEQSHRGPHSAVQQEDQAVG
eukprot:1194756-Prorocentrum_minimum.AAC.2